MDSGHSGSLQSSSAGDEEFDSRAADSLTSLVNQRPPPQNPPHHPPLPPHHHSTPPFDPLSNYFNLDSAWPNIPRSDPSYTDINSFFTPFSPPVPETNSTVTVTAQPAPPSSSAAPLAQGAPAGARNPRKRSRASRRAPTTVLTTDTTNFRAMVQEFTGIPAPPFASSSPFARAKLDLFCAPPNIGSGPSSDSPPFVLRPFAQKHQPSSASPLPLPLPLQFQANFQSQSQGSSFNLRNDQNDPVLTFQPNQNQLSGVPDLFSSDGSLDILLGERGKGSQNVTARTEGMTEPWLCSSDNR